MWNFFVIFFRILLNLIFDLWVADGIFCLTNRDKPGHRMNSHCSSTTKTLTQSTLYAPDNYRDYLDYGMAGQSASMKKTVSFNQWNGNGVTPVNGVGGDGDSPQSSTTGSVTNGTAGGHKSKPVGKKEKDVTSWCTRPVHLAIAFPAHTTVIHPPRPSAGSPSGGPRLAGKGTNGYMCSAPDTNGMDAVTSPLTSSVTSPLSGFNDQTMMLTNRPTSAPAVSDRMAGVAPITPPTNNGFLSPASPPVGHSLTDMLSSGIKGHRTASASFHDKVTTNDLYMETLASEYFPLTFGLSKPAELEVRQQPQIYNHPIWKHSCTVSSWRQPRRAKSPGRKRPGSAHSSSSSNSKSSIDKAYLMAVEAPAHGK